MNQRHNRLTSSGALYQEAYTAHYTTRDLLGALQAYSRVIAAYPDAVEAQYSRSQIRNIANLVVPAEELLAAETELALKHLQQVSEDSVAAAQP